MYIFSATFAKYSNFNRNPQSQISREDESFPHADFAAGSSWSHRFSALTNRKLQSLKVTSKTASYSKSLHY